MIYSAEELSRTYFCNLQITMPLYQDEYDYNISLERVIDFLEAVSDTGIPCKFEFSRSLEDYDFTEKEVMLEFEEMVNNLDLIFKPEDIDVSKDIRVLVEYWNNLYQLEECDNILD